MRQWKTAQYKNCVVSREAKYRVLISRGFRNFHLYFLILTGQLNLFHYQSRECWTPSKKVSSHIGLKFKRFFESNIVLGVQRVNIYICNRLEGFSFVCEISNRTKSRIVRHCVRVCFDVELQVAIKETQKAGRSKSKRVLSIYPGRVTTLLFRVIMEHIDRTNKRAE